ncbi:hypothetical protein CesoFtcFv8_000480 [Champsocephalus esox]|uniref:Uncharacterized protein n=2 Tax=Champsocephalus esox TaxID=159716 RepID=A0AAN8D2V0_9TELE|nr:hypothetical protein CesoFtcFv8_000480 [Champsocephalus esox]
MAMQLNVLEAAAPCTAVAVAKVDMVGQLEQIQAMAPEGDVELRQAFEERGLDVLGKQTQEAVGLELVMD